MNVRYTLNNLQMLAKTRYGTLLKVFNLKSSEERSSHITLGRFYGFVTTLGLTVLQTRVTSQPLSCMSI